MCQNNKMVNKLIQKTEWKRNCFVFKYNFLIKPEQKPQTNACICVREREREIERQRYTEIEIVASKNHPKNLYPCVEKLYWVSL